MHRLTIEINDYLNVEVIADTPAKVREDAVQLMHKLSKKHRWSPETLQDNIDKVEDNRTVIEDLSGGYIMVDYERVWL